MSDNLVVELYTRHPDPCPECGADLILHENGKFGAYYGCIYYPRCHGSAAAHSDGRPMGHAVTHDVKVLRILAHKLFDKWYNAIRMSRNDAYAWLDTLFDVDNVHIANLGREELKILIETVQREMKRC